VLSRLGPRLSPGLMNKDACAGSFNQSTELTDTVFEGGLMTQNSYGKFKAVDNPDPRRKR
jgi:hypothetical protein